MNPVTDIFQAAAEKLARERSAEWEQRLETSLGALRLDQTDASARLAAAHWLRKLNRYPEAILLLSEGLRPGCTVHCWRDYIDLLAACNRTAEAIAAAQDAMQAFPGNVLLRFKHALLLPVLYDSTAGIDWYRTRFTTGLDRLCEEIRLDTAEYRTLALEALGQHTNFYLGYQGRDDRELQAKYGRLAQRIMAAAYPEWTQAVAMPASLVGQPLRIGYVSARFRDLSATRYFLGWLRERDPTRFEIYTWHMGAKCDLVTEEVRRISHSFQHLSPGANSLERAAESIRACGLHVLVFLDIGLVPVMTQLAALRLAPIQCMAWDQPVTSGLDTVDYAFSGDLTEPDDGESHYSERLVRLPGVGVSYRKPAIPWPLLRKTRRDFSLRESSVVYLCCQSIFKFLPDNDGVFAEIAARVQDAQFVFVLPNPVVGDFFRARLARAFSGAGLRVEDHCVFLPQLKHLDYWNLHRVADIFLDTIGWSSGGSVFEAIACGVPVVTLPGNLMRSRQAFGILTQLGVTDTIAYNKGQYVDIAVRLAGDAAFRREVVERMVHRCERLYEDGRSTAKLEEFFLQSVALWKKDSVRQE